MNPRIKLVKNGSSDYAVVWAEKSYCKYCGFTVTLLYHKAHQTQNRQFYICWKCQKVFEIGKGEVRRESNYVIQHSEKS